MIFLVDFPALQYLLWSHFTSIMLNVLLRILLKVQISTLDHLNPVICTVSRKGRRMKTHIFCRILQSYHCSLEQSALDESYVYSRRFVKMLSFLSAGSSSLRNLGSSARSYSTTPSATAERPGLVWKHGHAKTKVEYKAELPKKQLGVAPDLIAKMRRLRSEAPKTFTARRLVANFHLSKKTVNAVAPYVRYGKAVRYRLIIPENC